MARRRISPCRRPATTGSFAWTPTSACRPSSQPPIHDAFARGAPDVHGYAIARRNRFLGRWLAHGEGYPDWNVRLFDRRHARWSSDPVHEKVAVDGATARLAGDLLHYSAESIDAYIAKQNRYTTLQAEGMHAAGETASGLRMAFSPLARFVRFYVVKLGFLDGVRASRTSPSAPSRAS